MGRPVRILVNGLHAKSGGGVTYLRELVPRLAEHPGIDLHLLLQETQRALYPDLAARLPVHWVAADLNFYTLLIWEQLRLPGLARKLGAKVTFSPANFGPLFAPGPVVLLRNTIDVGQTDRRWSKRLYWQGLDLMTKLSVRRAPVALAVSRYAAEVLTRGLPSRHSEKVVVVPHGCSERFRPAEVAGEAFLLAVGDIYVQKNLHGLIEAVSLLTDRCPDLELRIAGRPVDRDYLRRLKTLIAEKGVANRVTFLDHVQPEDLVELYRRCRLFVFPSLAETFGNPLVEAMACGAPVACSDAAAMPEVAGDAAVYFDPQDPAAMAEVIAALWTDAAARTALSEKAAARAGGYSWEACARSTGAALLRATGKVVG